MEELSIAKRLGRGKIRDSRSRSFGTKVTAGEERELVRAAELNGHSASEWAREVLLREARHVPDDALFTELVATRLLLVNLIKPMLLGKPVPESWVTEAMSAVRGAKHTAAAALRKEYAARERKES